MTDLFREPHYAAASAPSRLQESEAEWRLRDVLTAQARDVVSGTVKRWNSVLRTEVRAATALKLSDDNGQTTVPVTVIDGIPTALAEVTDQIDAWRWWLALHRPALERTREGLQFMLEQADVLADHLGETAESMEGVATSLALIQSILKQPAEADIFDRFKMIEEDVFGAYWISASKIQIYWMPLAIFAPLFGVSLSTLTISVLCHELVHAYTHRGVDTSGDSWSTDHFIQTDLHVTEGLAQYYTEHILQHLGGHVPDGLDTFLKKTSKQAAPYTTYQNWLGQGKQPSPEAVRLAMLEFRNAKPAVFEHEYFVTLLHSAQDQLSRRP